MLKSIQPGQRILIFRLGGYSCAIRVEFVREIVPMAQLACPPAMPGILHGLLNIGGTLIPVVRPDRLFALKEQTINLYTPLLVIQTKQGLFALMACEVIGVFTTDTLAPIVEAQHTFNGCTEAVLRFAGDVVHLLSVDQILLEKEQRCLTEFTSIEQERIRALSRGVSQ